jgi:hypothetical protein
MKPVLLATALALAAPAVQAQDAVYYTATVQLHYPSSSREITRLDSVIVHDYLTGYTRRLAFADSVHRLRIDSLPPGTYSLRLRARGYTILARPAVVCAGCTNRFTATAYTSLAEADTIGLHARTVYPAYPGGYKALARHFRQALSPAEQELVKTYAIFTARVFVTREGRPADVVVTPAYLPPAVKQAVLRGCRAWQQWQAATLRNEATDGLALVHAARLYPYW